MMKLNVLGFLFVLVAYLVELNPSVFDQAAFQAVGAACAAAMMCFVLAIKAAKQKITQS